MKNTFFIGKLISAIFITITLIYFMLKTPSPKIIFLPFLICSISMAGKLIGLIMNKRTYVVIFDILFKIGFFSFWFGGLIFALYLCLRDRNYRLILFTIPFWLVGIYVVKNKILNIKPKNKEKSSLNAMIFVSAGLVGIVLLAGIAILIWGISRMDIMLIFMGAFFTFGAFTFVLAALTVKGCFDKCRIDVLGLYVGILFVVIGIGIPAIKHADIREFGFWILIPIMMVVVGMLQIVKCLKNRE